MQAGLFSCATLSFGVTYLFIYISRPMGCIKTTVINVPYLLGYSAPTALD